MGNVLSYVSLWEQTVVQIANEPNWEKPDSFIKFAFFGRHVFHKRICS